MSAPVPRLLVVTDRRLARRAGRDLESTVLAAAGAGAPAVLLRERDLGARRHDLAERLARGLETVGTSLIVAGDPELARGVGAAGVHLAAADPPVPGEGLLVGRSCHDAREVRAAARERVDYVTVSPVAPTRSKPGYGPPVGAERLAALVEGAGRPVLALGGVSADNAVDWVAAGAHGVAVMGGVMGAADPGGVVRELLDALRAATGTGVRR